MTPGGRSRHLSAAIRVSLVAVVWGVATGSLSVYAGARAGSLGLVGTGCDVLADVIGSVVLVWRFRAELRASSVPVAAERRAHQVTAVGLIVVALGLAVAGLLRLVSRDAAKVDGLSLALAVLSLVGLPVLAAVKYRVAAALPSKALRTDAHTSSVGAATAAVTVLGLAATTAFGWSAADAVGGLFIAGIAGTAGVTSLRSVEPAG